MPINNTNLDYLLEQLRLQLGDTATPYRYTDEWLYTALVAGVTALGPWWNFKYLIDEDNNVYRNTNSISFIFTEPPIVQQGDERPIVLMASIQTKNGSLQNSSWNLAAWKDNEISYSNLEGGRQRNDSLKMDWQELLWFLKPPQKRLVQASKQSLPGFLNNPYETED